MNHKEIKETKEERREELYLLVMKLKQSVVIIGASLCLILIYFLSFQLTGLNTFSHTSFNINCLKDQRSPFLQLFDLILRVVMIYYLGTGTLSYSPRFERYLEVLPKNHKFISWVIVALIFLLIMDNVFASSTRAIYNCDAFPIKLTP